MPVTAIRPFEPVSNTSAAVNVGALIFLSKVTRTELNEVAFDPPKTAEVTIGPFPPQRRTGVVVVGGGTVGGTVTDESSSFAKLILPALLTFPVRTLEVSTDVFSLSMICV